MSDLGYVTREVSSLPRELRPALTRIFQSIVKEGRFGHPADSEPSQNFAGAFYEFTTPATPGDTFTIAHQFGRAPYLAIPVLALDTVNAVVVPLTVQRAADEKRIYLTSSEASATGLLYVEG